MKVTITNLGGDFFTLEVSEDMELENFKVFCEIESGVAADRMLVVWNGTPLLDNKKKLNEFGLKDGDMVVVQDAQALQQAARSTAPATRPTGGSTVPSIDFSQIQIPGASPSASGPSRGQPAAGGAPEDPAALRQIILNSPHDLALLKERNPPLAEALLSGSLERFTEVLQRQRREHSDKERDRIRLLTADPFDHEAQRKIAEEIRLKNVESNMETAMEYAPESFGQVVMLYIDCFVNGQPVKAFVDSGAQMTIMSQSCAERCNLMRLVDNRWAGIAKGVGTQKIIGRVHLCQIQIGPDFLQSSFSILENQPMDMLLGLDMLKRHQCSIDLKRNVLVIGTTGTETRFLAEGELPDHARLNRTPAAEGEDKQLAEALAKSASEASAAEAAPKPSSSSTTSTTEFPETSIKEITANGFSRQQAIEELRKSGGDASKALCALLAKSFGMP